MKELKVIYDGIVVVFDEDLDKRILELIDTKLSKSDKENILMIGEHEGSLNIIWKNDEVTSENSLREQRLVEICGDTWSIEHSAVLTDDEIDMMY